jgi:hypothetical protein
MDHTWTACIVNYLCNSKCQVVHGIDARCPETFWNNKGNYDRGNVMIVEYNIIYMYRLLARTGCCYEIDNDIILLR